MECPKIQTSTTSGIREVTPTSSFKSSENQIRLEQSTAMTPTLELFFHLPNQSTDTSGAKGKDGSYMVSSPEIVTELL